MKTPPWVGCAGWNVPSQEKSAFPDGGSHLVRYAGGLPVVEINSSFYRTHRPATYARWAGAVPPAFRFAVKVPKAITHEAKLVGADGLLEAFLAEAGALGAKLGVLLVQLPPSLRFDEGGGGGILCRIPRPPRGRNRLRAETFELVRAGGRGVVSCDAGGAGGRRPGPGPGGSRSRRLGGIGLPSAARFPKNVLLRVHGRTPGEAGCRSGGTPGGGRGRSGASSTTRRPVPPRPTRSLCWREWDEVHFRTGCFPRIAR